MLTRCGSAGAEREKTARQGRENPLLPTFEAFVSGRCGSLRSDICSLNCWSGERDEKCALGRETWCDGVCSARLGGLEDATLENVELNVGGEQGNYFIQKNS